MSPRCHNVMLLAYTVLVLTLSGHLFQCPRTSFDHAIQDAGCLNRIARIFAPHYRQANIG